MLNKFENHWYVVHWVFIYAEWVFVYQALGTYFAIDAYIAVFRVFYRIRN